MKSYLFRIALLGFAIYLVINCINLQVELAGEREKLRAQEQLNKESEFEIERLSNLIENGEDADFIESAARERLGFVFPDEVVYKNISGS